MFINMFIIIHIDKHMLINKHTFINKQCFLINTFSFRLDVLQPGGAASSIYSRRRLDDQFRL